MSEVSPKLDPRVVRTHQLIEDAFFALYRKKRVKDISVRDITMEAGINRATFYKHFQDKFDLFDSLVQKCFDEHLKNYVPDKADLDEVTFNNLVYATLLFIKDWRGKRQIVTEPTDQIIETCVQHMVFERIMFWIEPNYLKGPCDSGTEVAATAVSWAIFGIGVRIAQQKTDVPIEDVSSELVKMLAGGLWNSLVNYAVKASPK